MMCLRIALLGIWFLPTRDNHPSQELGPCPTRQGYEVQPGGPWSHGQPARPPYRIGRPCHRPGCRAQRRQTVRPPGPARHYRRSRSRQHPPLHPPAPRTQAASSCATPVYYPRSSSGASIRADRIGLLGRSATPSYVLARPPDISVDRGFCVCSRTIAFARPMCYNPPGCRAHDCFPSTTPGGRFLTLGAPASERRE